MEQHVRNLQKEIYIHKVKLKDPSITTLFCELESLLAA